MNKIVAVHEKIDNKDQKAFDDQRTAYQVEKIEKLKKLLEANETDEIINIFFTCQLTYEKTAHPIMLEDGT
ncbi:hypothetical protein ACFLZV_06285, partial [Candidatus Margulisiibacteriota bacterium]